LDISIGLLTGPAITGAPSAATIEITDANTASVEFFGPDPMVISEAAGNPSGQFALIAIAMTPGDTLAVGVTVAVDNLGGTATSAVDYSATIPAVVFNPGTVDGSVALIPIDPIDDGDHEPTETIDLAIGVITGPAGVGTDLTQTIEITDDDPAVVEFVSAASSVTETGAAYTVDVSVTVPGGGATSDAISVPITLSGTAEGADLTFDSSVEIPAATSSSTLTITVTPVDDNVREGDEGAVLTLGTPTGPGEVGIQATHTATISDLEDIPEVTIGADISGAELDPVDVSNSFDFAVTLSNPSEFTVTVDFSTTAVTAIEDTDYTGVTAGTVTFVPLDVAEVAPVVIPVDLLDEVDGDFTVTLADPSNATLGAEITATGTILDDDNVAPDITSAPGINSAEGASPFVTVQWTEPGARDTLTVTIDWGDGSEDTTSGVLAAGTTSFFASHTYVDDGVYTITYTVADVDEAFDVETATATINNITPVVTMPASTILDEGDPIVASGSFTDPGADVWTATVNYGDGTGTNPLPIDPMDQDFELSHVYADDGIFTITVCVQDDEGAIDCDLTIVDVENLAPVDVDLGPNQGVSEGETVNLSVSFSDPGSADTHTATIDWGDATPLDAIDPAVSPFGGSHVYSGTGVFTVTACVTDDDGATTCESILVSVDNAAPMVDAGLDINIDEGATATLNATFTDPDLGDVHTATIDWGDGTVEPLGTVTSPISADHVYPDSGSYTATLQVDDLLGAFGVDSVVVTVDNVDPTVSIIGPAVGDEGATLEFTADVDDPSPADLLGMTYAWEVTVDTVPVASGTDPAFSYTPSNDGTHTLTVTVTDP
ncbi:MAG: PKD domain-containing protein, partial [Acidimicrobiia bacterium]|nr:PKD domain-containing protein [Acidimicrobiia bacterium]